MRCKSFAPLRDHFILNPPPPDLIDNWVALVASTVHLLDVPANESGYSAAQSSRMTDLAPG